jgi:hypothetical protein
MEFMTEDELPHYIEEDEEEAAAAKQKRRQQSTKPPPPPPTPEEEAKRKRRSEMMEKLHEFDPKQGYGYYTRVWFVDFDTHTIDEESKSSILTSTKSQNRTYFVFTGTVNIT